MDGSEKVRKSQKNYKCTGKMSKHAKLHRIMSCISQGDETKRDRKMEKT
jgi:hypothetical protein